MGDVQHIHSTVSEQPTAQHTILSGKSIMVQRRTNYTEKNVVKGILNAESVKQGQSVDQNRNAVRSRGQQNQGPSGSKPGSRMPEGVHQNQAQAGGQGAASKQTKTSKTERGPAYSVASQHLTNGGGRFGNTGLGVSGYSASVGNPNQ